MRVSEEKVKKFLFFFLTTKMCFLCAPFTDNVCYASISNKMLLLSSWILRGILTWNFMSFFSFKNKILQNWLIYFIVRIKVLSSLEESLELPHIEYFSQSITHKSSNNNVNKDEDEEEGKGSSLDKESK